MMAKKLDRAEPKKECPSCGLGVSLEANICEFCGWDFEEEDEWILQIEKLERELMLEKQKFEPGSVNHMIESTLSNPVLDRTETHCDDDKPATAGDLLASSRAANNQPARRVQEPAFVHMAHPKAAMPKNEPKVVAEPSPKTRTVRSVKKPSPAPVIEPEPIVEEESLPEFVPATRAPAQRTIRKVRQVAAPKPSPMPVPSEPPKKTRAIRRVKD